MNIALIIIALFLLVFGLLAYFFVYRPIAKMNLLGSELYKDFFGNVDDKGL